MQNSPKEVSNILHNNSIETSPGLTIDDQIDIYLLYNHIKKSIYQKIR